MLFDLNVPYDELRQHDLRETLRELLRRGWQAAALNKEVAKVEDAAPLPRPVPLGEPDARMAAAAAACQQLMPPAWAAQRQLTQLRRLTLVTEFEAAAGQLAPGHSLRSGMGYDLVAIRTTSAQVFRRACTALDVDLIVLQPPPAGAKRPPIPPADLKAAVQRGVRFELSYAPLKQQPEALDRADFMAFARYWVRALKGRSLVLSSGACQPGLLGAPLEVRGIAGACLGFGSEPGVQGGPAKALAAISANALAAVERAAELKRGSITVLSLPDAESLAAPMES